MASAEYSLSAAENPTQKCRFALQRYHLVSFWGFLCFAILNAQRLNISIALVDMVESTESKEGLKSHWTNVSECPVQMNATSLKIQGQFNWDSEIQGHVLGAAFIGYIITQIPGGYLAEAFGASVVLIHGLFCSSLCNLATPWAAKWSPYCLIVVQAIKGMAQGVLQPAMSFLMAKWFPEAKRGFLCSCVFAGMPIGAFVAGSLTGELCNSVTFGGWPSVFYISGGVGCSCCILMCCFLYENPQKDPHITESELKYICKDETLDKSQKSPVPWIAMICSVSTWALAFAMFGQYWMAYYFLSVHPMYLGDILNFSIDENGYISSIPYILQAMVTWIASRLSDWLRERNYLSLNAIRKGNNLGSCIGFTISTLGLCFSGCDKLLNVLFSVAAMASIGLGFPGSLTVPVDMTPRFAGTLMGICSMMASISGFLVTSVVGAFTEKGKTISNWRNIFWTSMAVSMLSGLTFTIFGSSDIQKWNEVGEMEKEELSQNNSNGNSEEKPPEQIRDVTDLNLCAK